MVCGIFFLVRAFSSSDKNYFIEEIKEENYKYFSVYTDGKYGVLDEKGEMIVKNKFTEVSIPNPTKPVFVCKNENGSNIILNEKSEEIFKEFNNVAAIDITGVITHLPYEKSVLKYEKDGKYGLVDFEGKVITKPIYEEISSVKYKEGEILAKKDGKFGVISSKGKELIAFEYEEIEADQYYDGDYAKSGYIVKTRETEGYRYGYINSKWKKVLDAEYTSISRIIDIKSDKDIYLIASKNRTIRNY